MNFKCKTLEYYTKQKNVVIIFCELVVTLGVNIPPRSQDPKELHAFQFV